MALDFVKTLSFPSVGGAFVSDQIIEEIPFSKHVSAVHLLGDVKCTPTDVTAGAWKSDIRMAQFLKVIKMTVRGETDIWRGRGKHFDYFHYLWGGTLESEVKAAVAAAAMQNNYSYRLPVGLYPSQNNRPARSWLRNKLRSFSLDLTSAAEADVLGTAITANVVNHHKVDVYLETQDHVLEAGGRKPYAACVEQVAAPVYTGAQSDEMLHVHLKKPGRKIIGLGLVTEASAVFADDKISNVEIKAGGRILQPWKKTMAEKQEENRQKYLPLGSKLTGLAYWSLDELRNLTRVVNCRRESLDVRYEVAAACTAYWYVVSVKHTVKP